MLIKLYTKDASLHMIENVTDVSVPANPAFGDYSLEPWQVFDFELERPQDEREKPGKVITFAKDGPCMMKVWNVAYICTDEGKTIEKVYSGPAVV